MNINKTYKLNLKVLSPLAINDGNELSPLSDYFVDNGKVHYIDPEKFLQLLANDNRLSAEYENIALCDYSKIKDYSLNLIKSIIKDEQKLKNITKEYAVNYKGAASKLINLKTIIKVNDSSYIPGSSIKGAIKNALFFYWLSSTVEGKKELNGYIEKISALRADEKKEDFIKNISKNFRPIENSFLGIWDGILKQPSSNLVITDSSYFDISQIAVDELKRKTLTQGIDDWTLNLQEYVKPDDQKTVSFELKIKTSSLDWQGLNKGNFLANLFKNESQQNLKELFNILNRYTLIIKQAVEEIFSIKYPPFSLNDNEALLLLGSNKGILATSIIYLLQKNMQFDVFKNKVINYLFHKTFDRLNSNLVASKENFPISVSYIDGMPLGLVKIIDDINDYPSNLPSYTKEECYLGNPIKAKLLEKKKPHAKMLIIMEGKEEKVDVAGIKTFERDNSTQLIENQIYEIYYNSGIFNFNKKI
ncbi:type III-A CRISPR-associated RAMP protein Csm5 [Seramator thermalis]|uniref:type III-A CRISPR-associated RAMP protein Csm5 n=1 Tax=Seramator thermalis TaxID=2496270 RepID=UPI00101CD180|nr:type III-A CRISPR-associated RAMP protein Csm5 [Seramator thermalis]